MIPFDLVAEIRFFERFDASSAAKRTTRSIPTLVKTASWRATSLTVPRLNLPPTSLYSPSVFSLTIWKSIFGTGSLRGDSIPGSNTTGRRLIYKSNSRLIGISRPHSETWSGTLGQPTAPRNMASCLERIWRPSSGIIVPVCAYLSHDQSNSVQSIEKPNVSATSLTSF